MSRHRVLLLLLLLAPVMTAQEIPCPPLNQDLVKIPELASKNGKLKATIIVDAQNQNIPSRKPISVPTPSSTPVCYPQFVRVLRGVDAVPPPPATPAGTYPLPLPGPTLRARVGDLVQITFLNQIDPGDFPYSVDQGDKAQGCDETRVYPKEIGDTYPNCFHGSSTANIHFHGSHVNPNSTGDNVFIEVRPSLRTDDDKPVVTQEVVKPWFDEFFQRCEQELPASKPLKIWPTVWKELPKTFRERQEEWITEYDETVKRKLWPINQKQIEKGTWPQYYIGAFPYCFRIPEYKDTKWPPAPPEEHTAVHAEGAGTAEDDKTTDPERPLLMGQAPGLHWYHAHKHGSTAINVSNGMTGAFIIEGKYDDELNAFYGKDWTRSQPVMVINQLGVSPNLMRAGPGRVDKGPDFTVNGRLRPVIQMRPGEVQLWRIINTSSRAGIYFVAVPAVSPPVLFTWMQLAQDGVQLNDANYKASKNQPFLLMPGNRADILIQAPPTPSNGLIPVQVQNVVDPADLLTQPQLTLMQVNVSGEPVKMHIQEDAPSFPPFLADITDDEIKATRKILFSSTAPPKGHHFIDGKQFNGEVGEVVLLNRAEEWKVLSATYTPIAHPFHIHVNPFQVTEIFDPNETLIDPTNGRKVPKYVFDKAALTVHGQCYLDPLGNPDDWRPCTPVPKAKDAIWWDVFPIPSGILATDAKGEEILDPKTGKQVGVPGYFKMRSRFVDYPGFYVLHCHILAHEDRGMMTIVEVSPLQSPYSHH